MEAAAQLTQKDLSFIDRKKEKLFGHDNNFYPEAEPALQQFKEELSFDVNGLHIAVLKGGENVKKLFPLPEHTTYPTTPETYFAEVNFIPKNHRDFEPKDMSVALASILTSMPKFFELYPNDEKGVWGKPLPDYFYGQTNERMARFATNFGFDMMKNPDPDKKNFIVIGDFKKVKESFNKFTDEKPELIQGIIQRAMREQATD